MLHPLVVSARREAAVVLLLWCVACAYTVGYCGLFGYRRSLEELTFVCGFPDWVFYGVVAPWVTWSMISFVLSHWFFTDVDLGEEGDADQEFGS